MSISLGLESGGKPQKNYHIFCAKVISSIFDISVDERFWELRRRALVLFFKKNPDRKCLNYRDYNFAPLRKEIKDFWKYKPNLDGYRSTRKKIRLAEKAIAPRIGGDSNFSLYLEYLTTMVFFKVVSDLDTAVTILENHVTRMNNREKSELEQAILDLLVFDEKMLPRITGVFLEKSLQTAIAEGLLEREDKTTSNVKGIMTRLGYSKDKGSWVKK
jgi:hypothetical protein